MTATPHAVIRASAGSGKTYQLTRRYLRLVFEHAPPQSILATTFTRKAAGEILARVLGRVADAAMSANAAAALGRDLNAPGFDERQAMAMLSTLVRSLHRLSISTIDSFFNRVAQSFRYELGLPPQPQLVDAGGAVAQELRQDAIEAMLGDAAASDDGFQTLIELLRRVHHDAAVRSVTQSIDALVSDLYDVYRAAPQREQWSRLTASYLLDNAALEQAVAALSEMEAALPRTKAGGVNAAWGKAWQASVTAATRGDWEGFLDTGIAGCVADGNTSFSRVTLDPQWQAVYEPLVKHALSVITLRLGLQTQATFDLLSQFDGHFTRLRDERRIMLFSDLAYKLSRELPERDDLMTEVYYRLDGRVQHLLLDEFQDTSLEQWQVLAPLAGEIVAHRDGSRSFFCVGDVKQAIYGWRGGCAELFDHVVNSCGPGALAQETLSSSYRSSAVVLDAVNAVFTSIDTNPVFDRFPGAAKQWRAEFKPHKAARDLPGYVRLITSPAAPSNDEMSNGDEDNAPAKPHELFAAQLIADLHHQMPERDIGVLVRRNRTVNLLMHELRELGVPTSGEAGNPVTDCAAVAAVLSAIQLADHPADTAAAHHLQHSPMGRIVGLSPGTDAAQTHRVALDIRRSLATDGYADTIARWVRALAPDCDRRDLVRLSQLVEVAELYDPEATLRPARFIEHVRTTAVDEPTRARVRVMTIHASKGLEFDAVVLPELDQTLTDRSVLLVDQPDPVGPILGVYRRPRRELCDCIEPLGELADRQQHRRLVEDLCTLYVAMTRARHALHMVVRPLTPNSKGEPTSRGLTNLSYAAVLRQALRNVDERFDGGQTLYESGDPRWYERKTAKAAALPVTSQQIAVQLPPPAKSSARSWHAVTPSSLHAGGQVSAAELLRLEHSQARQRGQVLHRWLACIEWLAGPPQFDYLALAREVDATCDPQWVEQQWQAFNRTLALPGLVQTLSRPSRNGLEPEVWREREFVVLLRDRLLRGAFDRVVLWRRAGRIEHIDLIDFKSDRVDEARLSALIDHYRPQVATYREALAAMLNLAPAVISGKLVFLETGAVCDATD